MAPTYLEKHSNNFSNFFLQIKSKLNRFNFKNKIKEDFETF